MDYEALGRYTAAAERAQALARERHLTLMELGRLAGSVTGNSATGYLAVALDCGRLRDLAGEAARIDAAAPACAIEAAMEDPR